MKLTNRIFITGASGFIGSHLVSALQSAGHTNLIGVCRNPAPELAIETISGDFGDETLMRNRLRKDDVVVHLACTTVPSLSEADPARDIAENLIGAITLMRACRDRSVDRFIFFSSGGTVYGEQETFPVRETATPLPRSFHGQMKLSIERYIALFERYHGLKYLILRPGNPYGRLNASKKNQGIIDILLKKAMNNEPIEIWGDGEVVRDYIHIDDLTALTVAAIEKGLYNETLNAGTGVGTSVNEILDLIRAVTDKPVPVTYAPARGFDVSRSILSIEKAKSLLDWQPRFDLRLGIKDVHTRLLKK